MAHLKRRARTVDRILIEVAHRYVSTPSVTAAASIALPDDDDHVVITGSTTINAIQASRDIRHVTLRVAAGDVVTISGAVGRPFITTAGMASDSFLRVFWDGTTWHETERNYGDLWHEVGDDGEPDFGTNWDNAAGNETVGFLKTEENTVFLKGVATRSSGAVITIFTLPVGYRPGLNRRFAVTANSAFGQVRVLSPASGAVNLVTGAVANVALDGIRVDLG